ncbi:glycosyltransferase family 2 protein [Priestia megaterium]|uniref:glycosyltransferase family 2 protein n=1 Tax=Priestia megaterium TaxID=1404 RepID=UPI003F8062E3
MENLLVSIIVPVYNVQEYVERCIKSIIHQTYTNIEIIVVNDGSTDDSINILRKASQNDHRITIINKENGGQASARNLGLEKSNGEFILFVDSDDYLAKNTVQACVQKAEIEDCDLVIFDYYNVNHKGDTQYFRTGTRLDTARTVPWNKFYRKNLWNGFIFPQGSWYEDLGIIPAVVASANKIVKLDEPLYYYETSRGGSQTNSINYEKLHDVIYMFKNVYEAIEGIGKLEEKEKEVEYLFIEHILFATLLLKLPHIEEKEPKYELISHVNTTMAKYFPRWQSSDFKNGNVINHTIKKFVIKSYLRKNFFLGDLIWKYPKKLKTAVSGF